MPSPMALSDLFKRKSPVEKLGKDLREPYAQPEVRREAMSKLLEIATPEAYDALLTRFTFNANGHIADESEKRELTDDLVRAGMEVVEPIKRFVKKEKAIEFPLRALVKILPRDEAVAFLVEALRGMEPLDHRSIRQKAHLIAALGELHAKDHAALIVPYLGDHSDDVQFQAVEALERLAVPETLGSLVQVCLGDTHSARIRRRAAAVLEATEHSVKERFDEFNPELKSEYLLGKKGNLVKKTAVAQKPA